MNLTLKSISENNYKEILDLKVSREQEGFIETIDECLEEASLSSNWRTVGIYDTDKCVGFAMYALFSNEGENGRVWLDRFLISYEYQGIGYGEGGVRTLLSQLYKEYGYKKIYLSVYDNNITAINLYKKIGFKFNGKSDIKGEKIMVINLESMRLIDA